MSGAALVAASCFVGLACALGDEGETNFREDVLLCEEAVSRLQECCPELDSVDALACEYRQDGCNEGRAVDLNPIESRCIRDLDCEALRTKGTCGRAAELLAITTPPDASVGPSPVCTP